MRRFAADSVPQVSQQQPQPHCCCSSSGSERAPPSSLLLLLSLLGHSGWQQSEHKCPSSLTAAALQAAANPQVSQLSVTCCVSLGRGESAGTLQIHSRLTTTCSTSVSGARVSHSSLYCTVQLTDNRQKHQDDMKTQRVSKCQWIKFNCEKFN